MALLSFVSKQLALLKINTYLLTPWCRVLLELVKKFPAFHGTRRFITALTSVRHLSLSWASPIQGIYPHPTSWRSILILSTHLRLGLPTGLFPSGFPIKTLYTPLLLLKINIFINSNDWYALCLTNAVELYSLNKQSADSCTQVIDRRSLLVTPHKCDWQHWGATLIPALILVVMLTFSVPNGLKWS